MSPNRSSRAAWLLVVLVASGCTATGPATSPTPTSGSSVAPSPESPSPAPSGPGSAAAALAKLCGHRRPPAPAAVPVEGKVPPAVADVEQAVEQMRGLTFTQPVVPDAVSHAGLVAGLQESFDSSYPKAIYERKSLAWQTIGVIPPGTSIRGSLEGFLSSQVIGYYDVESGKLVFIGTPDPSPFERDTLAHELTHAIDDQHFGLERLDQLSAKCQDEESAAALATVEGNATYFQLQYIRRFLSVEEQLRFVQEASSQVASTAGIAPFIVQTQEWSYTQGLAFITARFADGGLKAIDGALTNFPVSTEQIIHPERYPNDVPTPVDVPDLSSRLGPGWEDLDVETVGEAWLSIAFGLRLSSSDAASAAAGWDGGIYRAWSDGDHRAVVMSTVWDTPGDAAEFAATMGRWIAAGDGRSAQVLPADGASVRVLFASDAQTLASLEAAAA